MIVPFDRIRTQNSELRQLQDAAGAVFKDITGREVLDGRLIEDVVLTGTQTLSLAHGLGRRLVGWVIVRKNATGDVWDGQKTNSTPARTLVLNNDLATDQDTMTISLWVF